MLEPGKLFVVGDPKQSIYRFRRADISLYDQVKRAVEAQPGGSGEVRVIRQNFRTTPPVVGWVNNVFAGVFDDDQEEGRQPGYNWVEPYRPDAEGARIAVLLGREYGSAAGESDAARRDEARALAALLVEMHGPDAARWRVQDRDAAAPGTPSAEADAAGRAGCGAEPLRAPRWGDVALLFRATTGLETYEQALREAGVPYRVDGGKSYFERREVADALLCLRAADDPGDGPALYGALHSSFFGFSDDDLFLFWAAGGRFDLFAGEQQPAGHEGIAEALETLRGLHERRAEREPCELAAELVDLAHAAEFLASTGERRGAGDRQPREAGRACARLLQRRRGRPWRVPRVGGRGRRRGRRAGVAGRRRRRRRPPSHDPQGQGTRVSHRRAGRRGIDGQRRRGRSHRGSRGAASRDQAQGGAARERSRVTSSRGRTRR